MKKAWRSYTQAEVDRFRSLGDVTSNGVVYDWWLAGPQGANFTLIKTPGTTNAQLKSARAELRQTRDVVGAITVAEIEE